MESDRVAVITGATGGLGRVVAQCMAKQGVRLALMSTNPEHLNALARELNLSEERCLTYALDVADKEAVQKATEAVLGKFSRADILLHLVGGWSGGKPVV